MFPRHGTDDDPATAHSRRAVHTSNKLFSAPIPLKTNCSPRPSHPQSACSALLIIEARTSPQGLKVDWTNTLITSFRDASYLLLLGIFGAMAPSSLPLAFTE